MDGLDLSYSEEIAIKNEIHDIVDGFTENDFEIAFRETRAIIEKIERICAPNVEYAIIGRPTNRKHPCWNDPELNLIIPYIVDIIHPDYIEYDEKMELAHRISDSCIEEHYDEAKSIYNKRSIGLDLESIKRIHEEQMKMIHEEHEEQIKRIRIPTGALFSFKSR